MDKKVIHVQSDPPKPPFCREIGPPFVREIRPPLNPVIFPCNVLPVIEPPFLGKTSLLAGAGRPSIAPPQGASRTPKGFQPAAYGGSSTWGVPPPGPPVACCPLARPERPRRHPRKGLAIEKKGEEVPARPEMRPQSGFRGWAGDEQRKGEKCAAGPQKRPAGALVSVRLLRRPAFEGNRRRGAI